MNKQEMILAMKKVVVGAGAAMTAGAASVMATPLISNDTLDGLGATGTSLGDFMGNLAPGLFKFLLLMGLAVAIVGVIVAIISVVKRKGVGGVK